MALFDLGLSRATTKFAAAAIGSGDHQRLPSLLGTSLSLQLVLGIIGGTVFFILSPWLTVNLLKIPDSLILQATESFRILGLAVPIVLVTNCLRGMLEALQRFDLINYVKVPTNASMFLSPILALPLGGQLPSIILLMTVFRFAAMLAYLILCVGILPKPAVQRSSQRSARAQLMKYGAWITVSNITGPILIYLDRFMIGILVSIGAVAYYAAPADMISRALIVPASLATVLFPAFSSLGAVGAKEKLQDFYGTSIKYLIMGVGPALVLAAAFARDILHFWLGPAFAEKSTLPLQILTVGVFVNSLAFFPYSLLQGLGRPNLTGLFHLAEIPLHFTLVWLLVARFGIVGAATASTIRVLVDTTLLFWACNWLQLMPPRTLLEQKVHRSAAALAAFALALCVCAASGAPFVLRAALAVMFLGCYALTQWRWSMDQRDREFLKTMNQGILARLRQSGVATGTTGS